jgi:hypothetical protein
MCNNILPINKHLSNCHICSLNSSLKICDNDIGDFAECPGYLYKLTIPDGYDNKKPLGYKNNQSTIVDIWFGINQLKNLDEDREFVQT